MVPSKSGPWRRVRSSTLERHAEDRFDVIVVNTFFDERELSSSTQVDQKEIDNRILNTDQLIYKAACLLKTGGLLYIYGLPRHLPFYAVHLNGVGMGSDSFLFKYWIAVELRPGRTNVQPLPNAHVGLLVYLKTGSQTSPTPFFLNTKTVRIPHRLCPSCGLNVRDWGGKRHLLNKLGVAVSDVWDFTTVSVDECSRISKPCLERIYDLTRNGANHSMLVVEQDQLDTLALGMRLDSPTEPVKPFESDAVIHADSLTLMEEYSKRYPEGVFDVVFADPPYNLSKEYTEYSDTQSEQQYVSWCNEWLDLMRLVLRPGGALFVLNIPKWAVYHAEHLSQKMEFRNWIVWDALSSPTGKMMPAHYALLYYTKPGGKTVSNYAEMSEIDSREYCLRASCTRKRKARRDDRKELLTDVWHDVHRIKHRRDRDSHPCQLPTRLMVRLIELASNPGEWVFDPFGGAGTAAIAARMSNRHFIISDVDEEYVKISERNLERIKIKDNGEVYLERESISRPRTVVTKKAVETAYVLLCKQERAVLSKDELRAANPELLETIESHYHNYAYLKKIARRFLEIDGLVPMR